MRKIQGDCSIDNCGRPHFAKSFCTMHYNNNRLGNKLRESAKPYRYMTAKEKIVFNTIPNDGCWIWQGTIHIEGYGKVRFDGKHVRAHRLSYIAYIGELDKDMVIDHLCENKSCVNPFHLEQVTIKENLRRYWKNRREENEIKERYIKDR